ncbi:RluA family pseudouridine synthase [Singulisphaera acidiphila]|uniref:Pseudouridine synthase n=1 Tax=Singulisphaera acidiphila (strain ATCC BAA-1392 / DSM 18658 / VKM B-2454 / MOB10) TaxID=886293 RepID=L0D6L9_SINAD|nr:RluA family pseudouridine synthase [Singulisphaera acidiphila]AGA25054.1 pseudouridine synthase, RluA family [Singulisphaera acidiphila DSM 18658]
MPIRLDKLVSERFGLSRRAAQDAVRNGRIDLEGERCDEPGREVETDTPIAFFPNRPKARIVAGRLRVLHEDQHVLIVDKPAGVLTLPTPDRERDTLIERAGRYLTIRHGNPKPFVGVVHRLDKDTSGALALARTHEAVRAFQALFKAHDIERQYLAVVEGLPARASGTIDLPLITDRGDLRRGVGRRPGEGRAAITHYRVIEQFGPVASLVACWLETGRTHQIRIHMAEIGHPVVGDAVYRPRNRPRCKAQFQRQALHAQTLGFRHPLTGQDIMVEATVPHDMDALIVDLRNRYGIRGAGG